MPFCVGRFRCGGRCRGWGPGVGECGGGRCRVACGEGVPGVRGGAVRAWSGWVWPCRVFRGPVAPRCLGEPGGSWVGVGSAGRVLPGRVLCSVPPPPLTDAHHHPPYPRPRGAQPAHPPPPGPQPASASPGPRPPGPQGGWDTGFPDSILEILRACRQSGAGRASRSSAVATHPRSDGRGRRPAGRPTPRTAGRTGPDTGPSTGPSTGLEEAWWRVRVCRGWRPGVCGGCVLCRVGFCALFRGAGVPGCAGGGVGGGGVSGGGLAGCGGGTRGVGWGAVPGVLLVLWAVPCPCGGRCRCRCGGLFRSFLRGFCSGVWGSGGGVAVLGSGGGGRWGCRGVRLERVDGPRIKQHARYVMGGGEGCCAGVGSVCVGEFRVVGRGVFRPGGRGGGGGEMDIPARRGPGWLKPCTSGCSAR